MRGIRTNFEPVVQLWGQLRRGRIPLPDAVSIPRERCRPEGSAGYRIRRNEMYFTLWVNEMHLAENRQWWSVFDPLVVVVTEFNYGQEPIAIPKVIGPNMIQKQAPTDRPRHGVVMVDTRVIGPYPYRGGDVAISVAFYQVERVNHARVLLNIVESLSTSLGAPSDIQAIAKTGATLLQGVEGLLGLEKTTLLAGLRMSMAPSPLDPFSAGFSALIAPPDADSRQLYVRDRRLEIATDRSEAPYRASDFVLLGVTGTETRDDENLLPFYPLKLDALTAVIDGDDGVKRGKANLIAAYQQMRKSPDVTAKEATQLFDAWLQEFEEEKKRLERTRVLSDASQPQQSELSDIAEVVRRVGL